MALAEPQHQTCTCNFTLSGCKWAWPWLNCSEHREWEARYSSENDEGGDTVTHNLVTYYMT